jgi:O-methyltransferase
MKPDDYDKLFEDLETALLQGARSVGILGLTPTALQLVCQLTSRGLASAIKAIYVDGERRGRFPPITVPVSTYAELAKSDVDVLVVADDENKEKLLLNAVPFVRGTPKVILSGYGHLRFDDAIFAEERAQILVPSLANGYPNTLTHLYQCLQNAARLGLRGVVAEFGMFRGGTTMLLSRFAERLGQSWKVIGFDTFDGFPSRRSLLDMYDHPDCVFKDLEAVQMYLQGRNVEIVAGDIVTTCDRLKKEEVVVSFIDTDNYTSARAALEVVQERTVVGGAIVFDHFTGVDRFRYTLGERLAAKVLLGDPRYFHLHDTGVFYRQK